MNVHFRVFSVEEDIPSYIRGENLEDGRARVDEFRAKSSSVYICLTSDDPILTAFYLIDRADKLAFEDPIFKVIYVKIITFKDTRACCLVSMKFHRDESSPRFHIVARTSHGRSLTLCTQ